MVGDISVIVTFCLVTRVCLTSGILTTKAPRDFQPPTSLQSPPLTYLPTSIFAKVPQQAAFASRAFDNGLQDAGSPSSRFVEGQSQLGYSYLTPPLIELKLPSQDKKVPPFRKEGSHEGKGISETSTSTSAPKRWRPRSEVKYHPQAPRRSSYQVVEEHDEYLTDDSDQSRLPHRGKAPATYPHRDSQDITTAIKALDHFLSGVLNNDSYNSKLHPPPNPVLALVLSRYGRYVPGARNPRVYANLAVNNIHNNKPFGSYKLECEEEPTYVAR